jgi:hypothetical protein
MFTIYGHYFIVDGYRIKNGIEQVLVFDPNGLNHERENRLPIFEKIPSGGIWVDFSYIKSDCKDIWIINN